MIKVVNKHKHESTDNDIYIGRGSPLGNKYSSKPSSKDVIRTDSRKNSVKKYKKWFFQKVKNKDDEVIRYLRKILKKEKKDGKVNLVCFCKPKICHGDVVKKFLDGVKNNLEGK